MYSYDVNPCTTLCLFFQSAIILLAAAEESPVFFLFLFNVIYKWMNGFIFCSRLVIMEIFLYCKFLSFIYCIVFFLLEI